MKPDTYSVTIVWGDEDQAFVTEVSELPGCMATERAASRRLSK
jgi:predicted RNase H-like HicB family nuclease